MTYIDWTDNLNTGITLIDEQHRKLIGIINDLHTAMKAGQSKNILDEILSRLLEYTKYHFSAEEKLMDQYSYPEGVAHKKKHSDMAADVAVMIKKNETGGPANSVMVLTFLKEWLTNHILKTDKAFGAFLQSKGVK